MIETGKGAIAIPRVASVDIIRRSATVDATSQTVGRGPRKWRRFRIA